MTDLPLSDAEEAFVGLLTLLKSPKDAGNILKVIEKSRDKAIAQVAKAEKAAAARLKKLEAECEAVEKSTAEVIAGVNAAEAALAEKEKAFTERTRKTQKAIDESQAESLRIKDEAAKASRKASRDMNAAEKATKSAAKEAAAVAATLERLKKAGIEVSA